MKKNKNLTESDIDKTDVRTQLEQKVQIQEPKASGWWFYKNNSLAIYFL